MIIYKIQENGEATDFKFSQKCPSGWMSIDGDTIPDDISIYHEKRYIDSKALLQQEQDILGYFQKYDYHFRTKRKKFLPDIETIWEPVFDKWDDQLDLVRAQIELMNEGKDFVLIDVEPVPVF